MPHTFIIGEIGQNHNGSVEIAMQLIDLAAAPVVDPLFNTELAPMDAIKLTKRDLQEELSKTEWERPYDSSNAFGATYGEHRAFLELDDAEHYDIYQYAADRGLKMVETLCARGCLSLLNLFTPDYLKVASRDLTNLPLLEAMAESEIPMILSTGMSGRAELDNALEIITKRHEKIAILHCLSQYPAEYSNINLHSITFLKEHYGKYTIGYSDHSIGIAVPVAAVAMGAEIIEKHITLDRKMKGSDHKGSLGPDGINRMVRDIRNIELSLGRYDLFKNDVVENTRSKLERSIAARRHIIKGTTIAEEDLHLLSPGTGYRWSQRHRVIGRVAGADIPADEIILEKYLT
jgi:sialic acid synthase